MGDRIERGADRAADLAGRRRLVGQLGMIGFERSQLTHQRVEVGVADLRFVERVVALVVIRDLGAQRFDPLLG